MIRIYITRQSRYPANTKILRKRVADIFAQHGVTDAEASIALVGERKMRELGEKFLGESSSNPVHEVLSFPSAELKTSPSGEAKGKFLGGKDSLGDIAVCYPEARKIAIKKNRLMDDVLGELVEHGALHLLGIHHPE